MSRTKRKIADATAAVGLKTELDAVLSGTGALAQNVEWGDAERELLRRWADHWTGSAYVSLWGTVEADARKLGGYRTNAGLIFQDLIFYTVAA